MTVTLTPDEFDDLGRPGERAVIGLDVGRQGDVKATGRARCPWALYSEDGIEDRVFTPYLTSVRDMSASPGARTDKAYAYALLRLRRFADRIAVKVERFTPSDYEDFVGWLNGDKRSGVSAAHKGRPKKTDPNVGGFSASVVEQTQSVVAGFYEHLTRRGGGPVISPVPASQHQRHHNPMQPVLRRRKRGSTRRRRPPVNVTPIPSSVCRAIFDNLLNPRDVALYTLLRDSGVRADEALSLQPIRLLRGERKVEVVAKGLDGATRLAPASEEFINAADAWLAYAASQLGLVIHDRMPLWWTLDRTPRPMNYGTLNGIVRRVNRRIEQHHRVHALRHTLATDLVDAGVDIQQVQELLGHRSLASTQIYVKTDQNAAFAAYATHLAAEPVQMVLPPDLDYDRHAMTALYGEDA